MRPGLPAVLDVSGRHCVVVGAGAGGRRKLAALVHAGAQVTVIDPAGLDLATVQSAAPEVPWSEVDVAVAAREWRSGDGAGAALVVVATDDPTVNAAAAAEAEANGALVLRADRGEAGRLRLPAVARRSGLTVAVDTGGGSPALAAVARDEVTGFLAAEGPLWDELARWAADNRPAGVAEVRGKLAELRGGS
ncbi:MAG: NAD(P)-dependent oxidoreductase [Actinomycetota bacterium]